ncbi:MAG: hypothetical protein OXH83_17825 [Bryobacterales bacterium]|nr:hypothetical protein [Bryobacterales bacterium]
MQVDSLPREVDLLAVCDRFREWSGLSESRIGQLCAGNPAFLARLRGGASCTIRLYTRALQWFSAHWPAHLEWPPDVPRPEPAPAREQEKGAA